MSSHIDYLAFTIPTHPLPDHAGDATMEYIFRMLPTALKSGLAIEPNWQTWEHERGKGFYPRRVRNANSGTVIQWGSVNPHIYVELPGNACRLLRDIDTIDDLLQEVYLRLSRIDVAVDIETNTRPTDFVDKSQRATFKSISHVLSPTGETVYVGSRKSERLARVYRYADPHPRSSLLRVEVELHKKAARLAGEYYLENGIAALAKAVNEPFKWGHWSWVHADMDNPPLSARAYPRGEASSVQWLMGDVRSAMLRYQREGIMDVRQWLIDDILPALADETPIID